MGRKIRPFTSTWTILIRILIIWMFIGLSHQKMVKMATMNDNTWARLPHSQASWVKSATHKKVELILQGSQIAGKFGTDFLMLHAQNNRCFQITQLAATIVAG